MAFSSSSLANLASNLAVLVDDRARVAIESAMLTEVLPETVSPENDLAGLGVHTKRSTTGGRVFELVNGAVDLVLSMGPGEGQTAETDTGDGGP
ncbi:hypothetical protein BGZ83_003059 [Gryganskiella cystojenkinii]|nr:hypothetical protein BGZ83_003059 [Gryganskiella cystojenkinii]